MNDIVTIMRTANFAARKHKNQKRKDEEAEPYLNHLIEVASLVAEATNAPQQTLIAEAVDLVVFVDEESSVKAGRKVREVLLVTGYSNGNYQVERV